MAAEAVAVVEAVEAVEAVGGAALLEAASLRVRLASTSTLSPLLLLLLLLLHQWMSLSLLLPLLFHGMLQQWT